MRNGLITPLCLRSHHTHESMHPSFVPSVWVLQYTCFYLNLLILCSRYTSLISRFQVAELTRGVQKIVRGVQKIVRGVQKIRSPKSGVPETFFKKSGVLKIARGVQKIAWGTKDRGVGNN